MARSLDWSPDAKHIAVGFVGGYFGVYDALSMQRLAWHHRTNQTVDVVRFAPNGKQVATGSHENVIDLYDVKNRDSPYHHRKRLTGHSSSITHLDWSADSSLLQSNCAAYEILYWDAVKGTNLRATKDSTESDTVGMSEWAPFFLTFFFLKRTFLIPTLAPYRTPPINRNLPFFLLFFSVVSHMLLPIRGEDN
mmetsp:Transcript_30238/g.51030  ORF Transcript_30238/g.51030 Transcript_30238/m.51030 type:complete len:193 (-) Transcript_30238:886-1464(-)